jgi:hypothetical protein
MQLKKELIQQIQTIIATAKDRAIRSVDTEKKSRKEKKGLVMVSS